MFFIFFSAVFTFQIQGIHSEIVAQWKRGEAVFTFQIQGIHSVFRLYVGSRAAVFTFQIKFIHAFLFIVRARKEFIAFH